MPSTCLALGGGSAKAGGFGVCSGAGAAVSVRMVKLEPMLCSVYIGNVDDPAAYSGGIESSL